MAGRHPKRERKVSKCTRWVSSVHHTHASHLPTQPLHAWPTKVVHNRTHQLRQRKHDTGGKRVVGNITHNRGRLAMEQGGAFLCTTHVTSDPHATLACIVKKRHLPNQTHSL